MHYCRSIVWYIFAIQLRGDAGIMRGGEVKFAVACYFYTIQQHIGKIAHDVFD